MATQDAIKELDELTDDIKDEAVHASERILKIAQRSNDIAIGTVETLSEQNEQLYKIKEGFNNIKADLEDADEKIDKLEGCCGFCSCTCCFKGTSESLHVTKTTRYTSKQTVTRQPSRAHKQNSTTSKAEDREEKVAENLKSVDHILDDLHVLAVKVGNELDRQNEEVKTVIKTAIADENEIRQANERLKTQINKH